MLIVTTVAVTAASMLILYLAFVMKAGKTEVRVKKLKQCPSCKRWQEVT
jgi:hypothetical protein